MDVPELVPVIATRLIVIQPMLYHPPQLIISARFGGMDDAFYLNNTAFVAMFSQTVKGGSVGHAGSGTNDYT
jgi:hypothetical protein